jgi:hypothetical protein
MSILTSNKAYKVSDLIVSKKDSAGINLLVSLDESDNFFRIDGLASVVWDMLQKEHSFTFIHQTLTDKYPQNKDDVTRDLEALLKQLIELKILVE